MARPGTRAVLVAIAAGALAIPGVAQASTMTVTSSTDDFFIAAGCSLREAVQTANTNTALANGCPRSGAGNNDTILIAGGINPVLVTVPDASPEDNADGDLDIEADPAVEGTLTIQGNGQALTTIQGGAGVGYGPDRLIDHLDGTLTIRDVTLKEGNTAAAAAGGGIRSAPGTGAADLFTLIDATVSGNNADTNGGGLDLGAHNAVAITNPTISGNHAVGNDAQGGGINVSGNIANLTISGGQISGNDVDNGPDDIGNRGGGLAVNANGTTTIDGTTISDNAAGGGVGGGVAQGRLWDDEHQWRDDQRQSPGLRRRRHQGPHRAGEHQRNAGHGQ